MLLCGCLLWALFALVGSRPVLVGGGELSPGVPGGGSVSMVSDGSVVGVIAGDEYGQAHGGRVEGGSSVNAVLADGHVGSASGGSRVEFVEGDSGAAATVGVVDAGSRVGVLGEYARVGFAVEAGSVADSKDAARLLDARLWRESADGYSGGGLRVSEGVRRSLYSGEGVSVALSVVARDGSSVVLGGGDVRRVLRGRPAASGWDVDAVFGSFESSFDRRAGEWAAGAGDVVLPPSGWDDGMEPFVDEDEDEWRERAVVRMNVRGGLSGGAGGLLASPPPCLFLLRVCGVAASAVGARVSPCVLAAGGERVGAGRSLAAWRTGWRVALRAPRLPRVWFLGCAYVMVLVLPRYLRGCDVYGRGEFFGCCEE